MSSHKVPVWTKISILAEVATAAASSPAPHPCPAASLCVCQGWENPTFSGQCIGFLVLMQKNNPIYANKIMVSLQCAALTPSLTDMGSAAL